MNDAAGRAADVGSAPVRGPRRFDGVDGDVLGWLAGQVDALGAGGAVVALLTLDGSAIEPRWWVGYADEVVRSWRRIELGYASPMTDTARSGEPVSVASPVDLARRYPRLASLPAEHRALAAVPLVDPAGVRLGAYGMSFSSSAALEAAVSVLPAMAARLSRRLLEPSGPFSADVSIGDSDRAAWAGPVPGKPAPHALAARLLLAVTPAEVLEEVAWHATAVIDVDKVTISLLDRSGRILLPVDSRHASQAVPQPAIQAHAPGPSRDALVGGKPVLISTSAQREAQYPSLDSPAGHESFAVLALPGTEKPQGVMGFFWRVPQPFAADRVNTLQELTALCGAALQRVAQYREQQQARRAAEQATARLQQLHTLARQLARAAEDTTIAELIVSAASSAVHASAATISTYDTTSDTFTVLASAGLPPQLAARWTTFPSSALAMASELVRTAAPVVVTSTADRDTRFPDMIGINVTQQAWVNLPLVVDETLVGMAAFGWDDPRAFAEEDLQYLTTLAGHAAIALERIRLQAVTRATAETLQRALLPEVATIPGWELATGYTPAVHGTRVGGDWYDAFALRDGGIGLALGDVAGKGIRAAAAMGAIRSALRAFATLNPAPATVMDDLNEFLTAFRADDMVTCCYAVLQPATGHLTYANAGHPPPLLVTRQHTRWLTDAPNPPLGLHMRRRWTQASTELDLPGDDAVLVLYSDGLVERLHDPISDGMHALAQAAADLATADSLQDRIDQLAHDLQHPDTTGDDRAVLALRRVRRL